MFFNKAAKKLKEAEVDIADLRTEINDTRNRLSQTQEELKDKAKKLTDIESEKESYLQAYQKIFDKYADIINVETAVQECQGRLDETKSKLKELDIKYRTGLTMMANLERKVALYEESIDFTEYGLYSRNNIRLSWSPSISGKRP